MLFIQNRFPAYADYQSMGLTHVRMMRAFKKVVGLVVQKMVEPTDDGFAPCLAQVKDELALLIEFFQKVYAKFSLDDCRVELSTRPDKSIGSDLMWQTAEASLKDALDHSSMPYTINPGDGAFYGPKIDFHIRDALKRSWQCGTIQLDFSIFSLGFYCKIE